MNNITRGGGVCSARRIPANQSTGGHGGHPLNLNNIFNKIKLLAKNISFLLCVSIIGFRLLHYGACGERHVFFSSLASAINSSWSLLYLINIVAYFLSVMPCIFLKSISADM